MRTVRRRVCFGGFAPGYSMTMMGAKQPALPTEKLWQLRLRGRALVARLRTSQLGRSAIPDLTFSFKRTSTHALNRPPRHAPVSNRAATPPLAAHPRTTHATRDKEPA